MMKNKMRIGDKDILFICDKKRHLVCIFYSIENLHLMAEHLNIKRCWFHKDHYDIPKRRIEEITSKCIIATTRQIKRIIDGQNNKVLMELVAQDIKDNLKKQDWITKEVEIKQPMHFSFPCIPKIIYIENVSISLGNSDNKKK